MRRIAKCKGQFAAVRVVRCQGAVQGSFKEFSRTAFHVTENETVCVACDDEVAIGATCGIMRTGGSDKGCVSDVNGLCFDCVEGMHTTLSACAQCDGAQRCVDSTTHLLCTDGEVLAGSHCSEPTEHNALLVTNNHVVKCTERHFADGEACGDCPSSCASCANASSCMGCTNGTSLTHDGGCAALENAVSQTHAGAVACDDASFLTDTGCVPCGERFGAACVRCSVDECLACKGDFVRDGGVCREGDMCAACDGVACRACVGGAVRLNATDCVPAGDCAVSEDGKCVQCVHPLVPLANGSCVDSEHCTEHHDGGVCLRCSPGMIVSDDGVCQSLPRDGLTHRVRLVVRHVRVQRVVLPLVRC